MTSSQVANAIKPRRHLLLLGGSSYRSPNLSNLPSTRSDFKTIRDFFTANLDYAAALPDLLRIRTANNARKLIGSWSKQLEEHDIVTLYYSGHGLVRAGRLYLAMPNTMDDQVSATALPAEELIRLLLESQRMRHLLVILDACYSGVGVAEIATAAQALATTQAIGSPLSQIFVLARTGQREPANATSVFSKAIADGILHPSTGGPQQEYIDIAALVSFISRNLPGELAVPQLGSGPVNGPCQALPNPKFDRVADGRPITVQRLMRSRKAREQTIQGSVDVIEQDNVAIVDESGEIFVGRDAALARLSDWRRNQGPQPPGCIVTGGPGSGKSAVIRRFLDSTEKTEFTETTSGFSGKRSRFPIRVRIDATGQTVFDLAVTVARAFNTTTEDSMKLPEALLSRNIGGLISLDSLDQASRPDVVIRDLINPLLSFAASTGMIKLLVGIRRGTYSRGNALIGESLIDDSSVVTIDLDRDPYADPNALRTYVTQLLQIEPGSGARTEYANNIDLAQIVAANVAEQVGHTSFLFAEVIGHALSARPLIDLESSWIAEIPRTVEELLDTEIGRHCRPGELESPSTVMDLLRPLAYAEGLGIPWAKWPGIATALSKTSVYTDEDVEQLLREAGDLVVESTDKSGISVYRLYHHLLTDFLRPAASEAINQQAVATALISEVPGNVAGDAQPSWPLADGYTLSYLPSHAARGGLLEQLTADPLFLVTADSVSLGSIFESLNHVSVGVLAFLASRHHFDPETPIGDRLSYLELGALTIGERNFAGRVREAADGRRWAPRWTNVATIGRHITTGSHLGGWARSLAFGSASGEDVVISGGDDGFVRIWQASDGHERRAWTAHRELVSEVRFIEVDGVSVLVTTGGSRNYEVRTWNVDTSGLRDILRGHSSPISSLSVGVCAADAVAMSGDWAGKIWVWDLAQRRAIRVFQVQVDEKKEKKKTKKKIKGKAKKKRLGDERISSLGYGELNGNPAVLALLDNGAAKVWNLSTGELLFERAGGNTPLIGAVAGWSSGTPVALIPEWGVGTRVWDPTIPENLQVILPISTGEGSMAIREFAGRRVAIFGDAAFLQLWDIETGRLLNEVRASGHYVTDVSASVCSGRFLLAAACVDGRVRMWQLDAIGSGRVDDDSAESLNVTTIRAVYIDSRGFAICGGESIRAFDLDSGRLLYENSTNWDWVRNVVISTIDQRPVIVAGDDRGQLYVLDLLTGNLIDRKLASKSWVLSLAADNSSGKFFALTGGQGREVKLWSLPNLTEVGSFKLSSAGQVVQAEMGQLEGKLVALVAGNGRSPSIWDLESFEKINDLNLKTLGHFAVSKAADGDLRSIAYEGLRDGVVITDLITGNEQAIINVGTRNIEHLVLVTSPQELLVVTADTRAVCVWSVATRALLREIVIDEGIHALHACWDMGSNELCIVLGSINGCYCFSVSF